MFSIDHLGIAVKSLTAAKAIYEKLGLTVSAEETVERALLCHDFRGQGAVEKRNQHT